MKLFEIWCEGHQATGKADLIGYMMAYDFKQACEIYAKLVPSFKKHFDPESMTYWGCKLFDNEKDARKSFG